MIDRSMIQTTMLPVLGLAAIAACGRGPALGSDNAIIAILDPELSDEFVERFRSGFGRSTFTTREEPIFEVTFADPADVGEFRRWKRLLVIEAWPGAVIADELVDGPQEGIVEVEDAWARGQQVQVISAADLELTERAAVARIDSLFDRFHADYIAAQTDRMWASDPDSALAAELASDLGFSILLPQVYRTATQSAPAATRTFYNEDPRRVVSIHWTDAPAEVTPDTVLAIRRSWGEQLFRGDEIDDASPVVVQSLRFRDLPAVRIQGVWKNTTDITAGVFVTYGVVCGERLVLLDGNIFAPDREKYPYVLQLDQIFRSFRCTGSRS